MHLKQRVGALLLTGLLALPLAAVPARAAGFTDLPTNHWAYEDLTEAAGLGILQGTGGGAINPTAPLPPTRTMTPWRMGMPGTRRATPPQWRPACCGSGTACPYPLTAWGSP